MSAESWEKDTTEYLLGVDYKRTPKRDTKFRNRYKYQSLQNEQTKFVKSVAQNTKLLRNIKELKPQKPGLVEHKVECDPSGIRFSLISPVAHFDLHNCEALVEEIPGDDGNDEEIAKCSVELGNVLATALKWNNGVSVKHTTGKGYRSVTKEINPTTTDFFDFESKTKFQKNIVPKIIDEYFTGEDVTILDGNNCHGETSINASKAPKGQRETEVSYLNSAYYNQNTENHSTVSEYFDNDEHKLLLVPFYDKKGLDTDVNKRYLFPYCAKFNVTVGKESMHLQHTFQLQLALSQSPQHYGLVFTFPLSQNHVLLIKSLISVYSIFPSESGQQCSITTYDFENTSTKYQTKAAKHGSLMANFTSFIESHLKKDLVRNLYPQGIKMTCDIANSQKFYGRIYQFAHKFYRDAKHKNKQELLKDVQHENTLAQKEKDFALNNLYYCRCTCYGCRDDTVETIYR